MPCRQLSLLVARLIADTDESVQMNARKWLAYLACHVDAWELLQLPSKLAEVREHSPRWTTTQQLPPTSTTADCGHACTRMHACYVSSQASHARSSVSCGSDHQGVHLKRGQQHIDAWRTRKHPWYHIGQPHVLHTNQPPRVDNVWHNANCASEQGPKPTCASQKESKAEGFKQGNYSECSWTNHPDHTSNPGACG